MIRGRLCAVGILISVYLAGVLLLSSVTLQNQQKSAQLDWSGFGGESGPQAVAAASNLHWCQPLHFITDPELRPVIALASFPGSGNTWLRYLLQQATGIYTGSVYKDYGLLKNGFPAESVMNGSVSVVKTHEWGPAARRHFDCAVLLVRAPGPAIQAEFNRQSGGHIGYASPDRYRRNKGRYWQQFVIDKLSAWKNMNLDWLRNFTGPTHVIVYEQLVADIETTLQSLLKFIKIPITDQQMRCALERREGIYRRRRRRRIFNMDPYTSSMKLMLKLEEEKVLREIKVHLNKLDNRLV